MKTSQNEEVKNTVHTFEKRRTAPLAAAVCSILAGLSLSPQVFATSFVSPASIAGTITLDAIFNGIDSAASSSEATITETGWVKFSESSLMYLYGSRSVQTGSNNDNSITIYGKITGSSNNSSHLIGGFLNISGVGLGNIQTNNNTVIFKAGSNTTNLYVYGGYSYNTIGTDYAEASGNTILIENGSSFVGTKSINGGYASAEGAASANGNTIILGSGTYTSQIYGGEARSYTDKVAEVKNNTVYLYGDADVSAAGITGGDSNLLIGSSVAAGGTLTLSGNTLVFGYNSTPWSPSTYTIGNVKNFSTIRFDNTIWGKTITINFFANGSTDSNATKVDATKVAFSGTDTLTAGSSYNMLNVQEFGSGSIDLTATASTFTLGTAVEGTGTVSLADANGDSVNDTVVYTVASVNGSEADPENPVNPQPDTDSGMHAAPQTHSAAMAASASAVALNQGADTSSSAAFNLAHSGMTGTQAFSSVGGGAARAKTGSHVTLNSLNFSVGIGNNMPTAYGTFSIGGAFEAGYGRFKNHFDAGAADPYIKKSGHVSYYGAALLGNMEFTNLWHVNAALRFGRMSSKVRDGLYDAGAKRNYDIDVGANYFGVELGGGKVIKINDKDSIDLYGKYFFLYQKGDNFSTSAETYKLDAVTSHRLRVAGRYEHTFTPKTSLYAGLGLEHEFDGKSKLKIKTNSGTFNAEPSEADGTRAFAEIGVRIVPEGNKGFNFDLGVKGLCGEKYRGAWATAEIKYTF